MKKIDKKGFALAEAIVVSVFILGMFTYIAMNVLPLISKYDKALNYDNPQEVYAANILYDELNEYYRYNNSTDSNNYYAVPVLEKNEDNEVILKIGSESIKSQYFTTLLDYLNISLVTKVDGATCTMTARATREYCNYLNNRSELKENTTTYLVQFKDYKFSHFTVE